MTQLYIFFHEYFPSTLEKLIHTKNHEAHISVSLGLVSHLSTVVT